jgi:hypothetical protein
MSFNLIQTRSIDPFQFSRDKLLINVAKVLRINEERIENIVPYKYQLWVHIKGVGGKFVSYRRLNVWLDAALGAIENCVNTESIKKLGDLFKVESEQYAKQYSKAALDTLRVAWSKKRKELHQEEINIALTIAYKQEAQKWLSGWQEIVSHCHNREFLKSTMSEIHRQKQEFADFPDVIASVERICLNRWNKLAQMVVG